MESDSSKRFQSIDEYMLALPIAVREPMSVLRNTIQDAAPDAVEVISYNMPAFKHHGILVYFAAHTKHVGFYPGASAVNNVFAEQLIGYETSKGTVRFPFDQPIPVDLVRDIVLFRVAENEAKGKKAKAPKAKTVP